MMKRSCILVLLALCMAVPSVMAQEGGNHIEVGVFADYFNLSRTSPHINFVGVGGRAASTFATTCRSKPRWRTTLSETLRPRFLMASQRNL